VGRLDIVLLGAQLVAVVGYLVPIVTLVLLRTHKRRPLWGIALDVPLAVSVDLLLVLGLCLFMTLERAVLVSRLCWIGGGFGTWWLRGRRRPQPPECFTRWAAWGLAGAVVGATGLSLWLSRPHAIWDRQWHIPLVASLRGQRLPFINVYDLVTRGVLRYHLSGDVLAAVLQTLSFDTIHASLALSLAHDVVFGLTAAAFSLVALALTPGRPLLVALLALALLLHGPMASLHPLCAPQSLGYSWLSFLQMSFRPHVSLSGLLFVGALGGMMVQLFALNRTVEPTQDNETPLPAAVASVALLSITDEASVGLLGLVLGLVWLVFPEAVHRRRWVGALVLAGSLLAVVGAHRLFSGSLTGDSPVRTLSFVPWRAPGYIAPSVPLWTREGLTAMALDLLPPALVMVSLVLFWIRFRMRAVAVVLLFLGVLLAAATVLLTRADVNQVALESHRFMTLLGFASTFFALLLLPKVPSRSIAMAGLVVAIFASSISTLRWATAMAPGSSPRDFGPLDLHALNCRESTGARVGERAVLSYTPGEYLFAFSGCHPTFLAGRRSTRWPMNLEPARPQQALRILRESKELQNQPMVALCPTGGAADPVCIRAQALGVCRAEGALMSRCQLPTEGRRTILATTP
jgi:hypothetical protein